MDNQKQLVNLGQLRAIIILTLCMVMVALGAYTYATINETEYMTGGTATISVSGEGEILARPDIASFTFAVLAEAKDAVTAQTESAEKVNAILGYLQAEGIEEKDIKTTNYSLNPRYDWVRDDCVGSICGPSGRQVLRGYEVSQNVSVKVREIDGAGSLLSGVGERGATNISSIQFTIDDEDALQAEARAVAVTDAREKAAVLAADLDMRLGRVVNFWEENGNHYEPMPHAMESREMAFDMAGGAAPELPVGENTVNSSVTIIFEVH